MGVKRKAEVMKPTAHPQEKPGGQLDTRMSRPENFLVFQARKITLGAFSISVGKDLGADESPPPGGGRLQKEKQADLEERGGRAEPGGGESVSQARGGSKTRQQRGQCLRGRWSRPGSGASVTLPSGAAPRGRPVEASAGTGCREWVGGEKLRMGTCFCLQGSSCVGTERSHERKTRE